MQGGEQKNGKTANPEIQGVERGQILRKPDDEAGAKQSNGAEKGDRAAAVEGKAFLHESNGGLEHGERAGEGGDEKKKEPKKAEELTNGHMSKNEGKGLEPETESTADGAGRAEKKEGRRNSNQTAERDLAKLISGHGGGGTEGDIIFFLEIASVVNNDAEPHGKRKKDLGGGGHPHLGMGEGLKEAGETAADIPHVGEAGKDVAFGVSGVGRAKGENTKEDKERTKDKEGHAPKADLFNATAQATVNDKKVQGEAKEQTENGERETVSEKGTVRGKTNKGGEVGGVSGGIDPEVHLAGEVFPSVTKAPRFNPEVVHVDDDRNDESKDTEVGGKTIWPKRTKNAGAGVKPVLTPATAHSPL